MNQWFLHLFAPNANLPAGGQEWNWGYEGLSWGWAFFLFLLIMGGCVWAYAKCAEDLTPGRRRLLLVLRGVIIALFLLILIRPVLNITISQSVRQPLLVLLDASKSMQLTDLRTTPEDIARAALAAGLLDPAKGINQPAPADVSGLAKLSRRDLLGKLAANEKLNLWARLQAKSDVTFYRFGRDAAPAGSLVTADGKAVLSQAVNLFKSITPDEPATAIGESLREVLDENRGRPVGGILLITDGGNNSGLPPEEAAKMAAEQNIPLFIYGVGVPSPPDLILKEIQAPDYTLVKDRTEITVKMTDQGFTGQTVAATLTANGKEVDTEKVELNREGDYQITFHFVPQEIGELALKASIAAMPGEINTDNNVISTKLTVSDSKAHVLLIDQDARWDFRYLLAYLQRDRRMDVHCVLLDAEPGLDTIKDSPFLATAPTDKSQIFRYDIIIIGDVDPGDLGTDRMKLIQQWVDQMNGGVIFMAGPNFDPSAYTGTPLEPLLPVVPDPTPGAAHQDRSVDPMKLTLTPEGENSPYLQLSEDPSESKTVWNSFAGVRWTAPVLKAKPGAQVLLTNSAPGWTSPDGPAPVLAIQDYGSGRCVYIGTDETYRWRSRMGEKYYSQIWGKILQTLYLQRFEAASALTQLKAERQHYLVGDKVVISGKVFKEGFEPLEVASLPGKLTIQGAVGKSGTSELDLSPVPGEENGYRAELTAQTPGDYSFSTIQDPKSVVKFTVEEPNLEFMSTGMNENLLKSMAVQAHGHFLREEDLNNLPDLVSREAATVNAFRKIDLSHSPWLMALLVFFLLAEWLLRRLMQLK